MAKNKLIILGLLMLLFNVFSVYSASWYDYSCWFNDKPELGATITIYDSNGVYKASVDETSTVHIDNLVINEGDQIKIDFGLTTDDENNIQQERIFWNHNIRNDWTIGIQDNVATTTTISTKSPSSTKFDFYSYLTGGIESNSQYYQENTQSIQFNDGNPQFDYVKTFKPQVGSYELLLRVSDSCGNDGIDEDYVFIPVTVNPIPVQNNNYDGEVQDNFDRADGNILGGTATNGNVWAYNNPATFFISNGEVYGQAFEEPMMGGYIWSIIELPFQPTNPNYFSVDVKLPNDPTNNPDIWFAGRGTTNYGFGLVFSGSGDLLGWNSQRSNYVTLMTLPTDEQYHTYELRNIDVVGKTIDLYYDGSYVTTWSGFEQNTNSINRISIYPQGTTLNTNTFIYFDNIKSGNYPLETNNICNFNRPDLIATYPSSNYDIIIEDGCDSLDIQTSYSFNIYDERINEIGQNIDIKGYGFMHFKDDKPKTFTDVSPPTYKETRYYFMGNSNNILNNLAGDVIFDMTGQVQLSDNSGSYFQGTQNIDLNLNYYGYFRYPTYNSIVNTFGNGNGYLVFDAYTYGPQGQNMYWNYNTFDLSNVQRVELQNFITDYDGMEMRNNIFKNIAQLRFMNGMHRPYQTDIYANKFISDSLSIDTDSGFGTSTLTLGKSIGGKMLGNIWVDSDGNDLFSCPVSTHEVSFDGQIYNVCNNPVIVGTADGTTFQDYIIVTNGQEVDPIIPIIVNKKPNAIIKLDTSQEVQVGATVCWDTSDSFDSDGTIVKKTVWEGDKVYTNKDSNCLTKTTPTIISVKLQVEDNDGDTAEDIVYIKWSGDTATCSDNIPADLVITNTPYQDDFYWLNMTVSDQNGDSDFTYAWTVNGETIYGEDILKTVNYNQNVYASVFDGCNITSDYMYIDVGKNYSDPIESIGINLVCSQSSLFAPANVNCELIKDLKGENLDSIYWTYDNDIITENEGASIYSKNVGDINTHLITVTVTTLEGQVESDYYRFNFVSQPPSSGGGGGGTTPIEKVSCDIDVPNSITIDEDSLIVPITLENNEDGSWSPDYVFLNVDGEDSVLDDLSITNIIGTLQAGESKDIGVKYNMDIFNTQPIDAQNIIRFTSDNCKDVDVKINIQINTEQQLLAFVENDLLSSLSPDNLVESTVLTKEQIGSNDILEKFKIWHLAIILFLISMFMFWNVKYSKKAIPHYVIKSLILTLVTGFLTIVMIYFIRWIIGLF